MQQDSHSVSDTQNSHKSSHHPLKIHVFMGMILLILAFIGVILTSWQSSYTHVYWLVLILIYALTSLGFTWFSARREKTFTLSIVGRELSHWLGLIVCVSLVEHFKQMGLFSLPIASLVELLLLALTSFLAGVHFNSMFLFVGIFLALIALLSVIVLEYLSLIMLPLLIIFIILLWWYLQHKHRAEPKSTS